MPTVNIVRPSPGPQASFPLQRGGGGGQRDRIALGRQQLAAGQRESDQDRQLRELALLLGAEQTQASLALSREQLGQQGEQFAEQLRVSQDEAKLERSASETRLQTEFEGQLKLVQAQLSAREDLLKFQKKEAAFDRQLSDLQFEMNNFATLAQRGVALAGARGQARAKDISDAVSQQKGSLDSRNGNLGFLIARSSNEEDLGRNLPDIESGVDSLIRAVTTTVTDPGLERDQRAGGAAFLAAADPTTRLTALQSTQLALLQLRAFGDKRQVKKINELVGKLSKFQSRTFPAAAEIITAFNANLAPLTDTSATEEVAEEAIRAMFQRRGEIVSEQDPTLRFTPSDPRDPLRFETQRGPQVPQREAQQRLSEILGGAGGGGIQEPVISQDAGAGIRSGAFEREEVRQESQQDRATRIGESISRGRAAREAGQPLTVAGEGFRQAGLGIAQDVSGASEAVRGLAARLLGGGAQPGAGAERQAVIQSIAATRQEIARKRASGETIPEGSPILVELKRLEERLRLGDSRLGKGEAF